MVKAKDLMTMNKDELTSQVVDLKQELSKERATIASGTRSENPGKIKKIRKDIARILTVLASKRGEQ